MSCLLCMSHEVYVLSSFVRMGYLYTDVNLSGWMRTWRKVRTATDQMYPLLVGCSG